MCSRAVDYARTRDRCGRLSIEFYSNFFYYYCLLTCPLTHVFLLHLMAGPHQVCDFVLINKANPLCNYLPNDSRWSGDKQCPSGDCGANDTSSQIWRFFLFPIESLWSDFLTSLISGYLRNPIIFCCRSMWRSCEQSRKCSEVKITRVKITRLYDLSNMADTSVWEILVRKGLWAFILDGALWVLIGWARKLRSRGL